ncbi:hypothetical protein C8R43DRAFT_942458 [Mycena crocata]|nr:hypothetical protein C8R43DRAFT_942458 [Mycena crocata]
MPTESSSSALKAFEDGGRKHVDCQALLENSFRTFSMLERWEKAESIVPSVTAIILRVRQQGRDYFETLNDSISVAIKLYELAQDSVQLVGFLLDPEQKTGEIQEFIAEMRAYTHAAVEKSKYISTKCRKVRKGVNEITSIIPNEMEKLERREQRLVLKTESVQRRIERAKIVKTVSAAALAVVSGVATFVFPPMLLILPVGLPIAILALEAYEHRSSRALMKRRDEILDCQAGLRELDEITMGLTGLARHIDSLTEFWVRSDTMLETIYNGVHRMRDNTARLRLATIMNGWERAAEVYMDYAAKAS